MIFLGSTPIPKAIPLQLLNFLSKLRRNGKNWQIIDWKIGKIYFDESDSSTKGNKRFLSRCQSLIYFLNNLILKRTSMRLPAQWGTKILKRPWFNFAANYVCQWLHVVHVNSINSRFPPINIETRNHFEYLKRVFKIHNVLRGMFNKDDCVIHKLKMRDWKI